MIISLYKSAAGHKPPSGAISLLCFVEEASFSSGCLKVSYDDDDKTCHDKWY